MKVKIMSLSLVALMLLLSASLINQESNKENANQSFLQESNFKIIFISQRDGSNQIYTMDIDGSNQRRVSRSSNTIYKPKVSPDGKSIAYYNEDYELWICDIDGNNQNRISQRNEVCMEPSWSPDGGKIVYSSERGNYEDEDGDLIKNIWEINLSENEATQLTFGDYDSYYPSYSPDGERIVYESLNRVRFELMDDIYYIHRAQIYTMNVDGSDQVRLTAPTAYISYWSPRFSPDGKNIVYNMKASVEDQWSHIYIMNADGGNPKRISKLNSFDENPCWSPDGNEILYETVINEKNIVMLMDIDGSNQRLLTDASSDNFTASFFPAN